MMTVELLLAFFFWAIFLTGIVSLWFSLFGPNLPLFNYINQENFFVSSVNTSDLYSTPSGMLVSGILATGTIVQQIGWGIRSFISPEGIEAFSTDWRNGVGQKTCRGIHASKIRSVNISTPIVLDDLNVASSILVRGQYIYLATNSSSTTDPDIYAISIKDPKNPAVISKIDTGPGLASLSAAGYMLYAANTSINSQAQAIDIGDPANMKIKWTFKVPGSLGTSTALGKAIASNGDRVFLGTAKNNASELFSIDAETGQLIASQEMGAGVNNLFLDDSILFAAMPTDPELSAFDVSSRSALRPTARYDAPGGSGNGKSIEKINNDIYFGRTLGGNELMHLKIQSNAPSGPSGSSTISISRMNDWKIGGTVDDLIAGDNTLFVLTANSQKELQVWNIATSTGELALSQTIDLPARGVGIGCSRNYIYVALGTNTPLLIFELGI